MLVALVLLMLAIAVVAFRDREFLFESEPVTSQQAVQQVRTSQGQEAARAAHPVPNSLQSSKPQTPIQKSVAAQIAPATQAKSAAQPKSQTAPRAVTVQKPASTQKHTVTSQTAAAVTAQAAQRARIADVTIQEPNATLYPRLDQRTKVEGSVELQALVGTDGTIQELHVLRGPAVLGSAAREAVLQWKFKPYTQNGVAVETYARITVNFTIKVIDGSPKTVASVEPEHVIILADNYQR
jgi:TonB family protein